MLSGVVVPVLEGLITIGWRLDIKYGNIVLTSVELDQPMTQAQADAYVAGKLQGLFV